MSTIHTIVDIKKRILWTIHANKSGNLDEMDEFTERQFPKLTQEETDNLNILKTIREIKFVVRNLHTRKTQTQMALLENSTKHFRRN